MMEFLKQRPWIWVVVVFVVLFSAWGYFFFLATKYQPEKVPLEHLQTTENQ